MNVTRYLSKHAKYRDANPISRYLVSQFFQAVQKLYGNINPSIILDVGCGEGVLLKIMEEYVVDKKCYAIDLDPQEIEDAKRNVDFCDFRVANIYEIPFEDNNFDLVFCTEVLEHMDEPEKALTELHRVTNEYAILTVPKEPLWRILNLSRLRYVKDFGNTPDHKNHWSSEAFKKFVGSRFEVVKELNPVPWNCLLCKKK